MDKWYIKNNWIYTISICIVVSSIIYSTKLLQAGDKATINAMIDIDQTIAKMNVGEGNFSKVLEEKFSFSNKVMEDQ
jgi:hypothetical protein